MVKTWGPAAPGTMFKFKAEGSEEGISPSPVLFYEKSRHFFLGSTEQNSPDISLTISGSPSTSSYKGVGEIKELITDWTVSQSCCVSDIDTT